MKIQIIQKSAAIRFRRWSRAGYAIFRSLKNNVTIGNVSVEISDKSLQKTTSPSKFNLLNTEYDADSPDKIKELSEIEIALAQFNELNLVEFSAIGKIACAQNLLYLNYSSKRLKGVYLFSTVFFFYSL